MSGSTDSSADLHRRLACFICAASRVRRGVRLEIAMANPLLAPVLAWLGRLKYPQLFAIAATLFAVDLVVPDIVPFIDEIMFALITLLFGSWKKRREERVPAPRSR